MSNDNKNGTGKHKNPIVIVLIILVLGLTAFLAINLLKKDAFDSLEGKNIVLITLDTTRADYISAYGSKKADTPHLDTLAKEGFLFTNCIAQTPLTLPAHLTLLSSTYPQYNNVRDNAGFIIPEQIELLSETLLKAGYKTAAHISSFVLHSKWGLNQGFQHYSDDLEFGEFSLIKVQQRADKTVEKAKAWIKNNKGTKFFSWVHLYDPHTPYDAPAPFDKHEKDPYRGEIEYMDHHIGSLLTFLKNEKLYDNTVIIAVGDHGEALGQHGERTHGLFIYDESVRVPLIIKLPKAVEAKKLNEYVELVDIAPTILETQHIPFPDAYQGMSMLGFMKGDKPWKKSFAYTESYYPRFHFGWSELKGFYFGDNLKYIMAPTAELYDLNSDPEELKNIYETDTKKVNKYQGMFRSFLKSSSANAIPLNVNRKVSKEDMAKLRSLGYLGNTVDISDKKVLPNPVDKVHLLQKLSEAVGTMKNNKDYDSAIKILNDIISEDPNVTDAYFYLGNAYKRKGMYKKALGFYQKSLKMKPDSFNAMSNIISTLIDLREYDRALKELDAYQTLFPEDFNLYNKLGKVYLSMNRLAEATKAFQASLDLQPNNSIALKDLARIYLQKGKLKIADRYLNLAANYNGRLNELYFLKGLIADKLGDKAKAVRFYKQELKNNPESDKAMFNLAIEQDINGEYEAAEQNFRRVVELKPRFKGAYFLLAKTLYNDPKNYNEVQELCTKGLAIGPEDRFSVFGYLLLADLLHKIGDDKNSQLYFDKGMALKEKLQN